MAYVYRHIRLDKNEPFYIGIGSDSNSEYKRAFAKHQRSKYWNDIVAKTDYKVQILFDDLTWEQACEKEKELIALYGRHNLKKGTLCNLTDGGEGVLGHRKTIESINKAKETLKKKYDGGYVLSSKGKKRPKMSGENNHNSIKVIDTNTKIIYNSIVECEKKTGIKKLQRKLNNKNTTSFMFLKDYENNDFSNVNLKKTHSTLSRKKSEYEKNKIRVTLKAKHASGEISKCGENNPNYGNIRSEETKQKMSDSLKGKIRNDMIGEKHHMAKKCKCLKTNIEWGCIKDCAISLNISYNSLYKKLNGIRKNNTSIILIN